MDVGFLIDSSGSVNNADKYNFQRIKDYIKGFIKSVVIGENDTRIGIATYSSQGNFKIRFNFTAFYSAESLVEATQNIPYDPGNTYTGEALDRIRLDLFSTVREGLPAILIVMTDGRSRDNVTMPSKLIRDNGVHVISVGVASADYAELAVIASVPNKGNIFNVSFTSLNNLVGPLVESVCRGNLFVLTILTGTFGSLKC